MDVIKVRQLAFHALSGFRDMEKDDAVEMALWDLCDILLHVANDPASVALVARIESSIRGERPVGEAQVSDAVDAYCLPDMSL